MPSSDGPVPLRLSVVVPFRDGAEHLAGQLQALAEQHYPGWWEVLLVDNGSRDHAPEVAARYLPLLPRARLVTEAGRPGKPHAVNAVARQVRGEAILLLDADDVVAPGYLTAMAEALEHADLVGGRLDADALNPAWLRSRRRPVQADHLEVLLDHRPAVVGSALGVRTDAFRAVDGFDEDLVCQEDVDLSWRLQEAGYRAAFAPRAVVRYRYRTDLAGIWRQERAYGRYEALLYAKHRDGLRRRRLRRTVREWAEIPRAALHSRHRAGRARLATVCGAAVGRADGSLRHRVAYL